jgi:gluconate 2-dehydrogenase gamma chain
MTTLLNRREALQRVALLMGGTLSSSAVLGVLNGCTSKNQEATWKPVFLTQDQGAIVSEVADLMIPRTDTPGAVDVGVPAFIDTMLKDVYAMRDQERFITGLEEFEAKSQQQNKQAFLKLEPAQRMALVQSVHDAAVAAEKQSFNAPDSEWHRPFILMVKELTLLGYFTSEAGATKVLQYIQVPGAYVACVPIAKAGNGKTWATETSRAF